MNEYKPGLYLVATPIGNLGDITQRALEILEIADLIACEDTRQMRKLLQLVGITRNMSDLISVHEHNEVAKSIDIASHVQNGKIVVYSSDAGMPAISDPGAKIVSKCHEMKLLVSVIPGASAVVTAVALSGYGVTSFSFYGFFPRVKKDQEEIFSKVLFAKETSIFFESPQRLSKTLNLMKDELSGERKATVCRELTKKFEEVISSTLEELTVKYDEDTKGECVIVIGPAEATSKVDDSEKILEAVSIMKRSNMSLRDTVEIIEKFSNLPKNMIKKMYTEVTHTKIEDN